MQQTIRQKLKFTEKIAKSRFVPPVGGLRGNVHGSSMARWKARCRLPISAGKNYQSDSQDVSTAGRHLIRYTVCTRSR